MERPRSVVADHRDAAVLGHVWPIYHRFKGGKGAVPGPFGAGKTMVARAVLGITPRRARITAGHIAIASTVNPVTDSTRTTFRRRPYRAKVTARKSETMGTIRPSN